MLVFSTVLRAGKAGADPVGAGALSGVDICVGEDSGAAGGGGSNAVSAEGATGGGACITFGALLIGW